MGIRSVPPPCTICGGWTPCAAEFNEAKLHAYMDLAESADSVDSPEKSRHELAARTSSLPHTPGARMTAVTLSLTPSDYLQDLSPDALPATTETRDTHVKAGSKYAQIGGAAVRAYLDAAFTGVDLTGHRAIVLVNLWPHVGEVEEEFWKLSGHSILKLERCFCILGTFRKYNRW